MIGNPSPAYHGLTINISAILQELKGHPWKVDMGNFVNVQVIEDCHQRFSKTFDVETWIKFQQEGRESRQDWKETVSVIFYADQDGREKGIRVREMEISPRASGGGGLG
jgi:hypothetical protein